MERKINPVLIGGHTIGPGKSTCIVAEIGINHNGFLKHVFALIDAAVAAGCDAVKFQKRTIPVVYSPEELERPREVPRDVLENALQRNALPHKNAQRLIESKFSNSTNGDLKYALEFSAQEYQEIARYCASRSIMWFASCWDTGAIECIEQFNPPCHKIASACNEDDELLRALRATGKPLILSTGMTDLQGVHDAVRVLGNHELIILHCTSVYPTGTQFGTDMLSLINLAGIDTLQKEFGVPVGFSSHDSGIMPTYAAVVRGACMVEKHITLEPSMWGSDQRSSIPPHTLIDLCRMIREFRYILGNGEITILPSEVPQMEKLRRVRRQK